MDFLVYSRAVPESEFPDYTSADEERLNERHWSYMDGFADGITARGPTLGPDRDTWTGSLHIVDLPDADAAHAFVADEPYHQTGLFARHSLWRFSNLLGRTMWEFAGAAEDPKFLILAHSGVSDGPVAVADLGSQWRESLVVYGALSTLDDEPAGLAVAVQVPSRDVLDELMADPSAGMPDYREIEVHDWEFGGRR